MENIGIDVYRQGLLDGIERAAKIAENYPERDPETIGYGMTTGKFIATEIRESSK